MNYAWILTWFHLGKLNGSRKSQVFLLHAQMIMTLLWRQFWKMRRLNRLPLQGWLLKVLHAFFVCFKCFKFKHLKALISFSLHWQFPGVSLVIDNTVHRKISREDKNTNVSSLVHSTITKLSHLNFYTILLKINYIKTSLNVLSSYVSSNVHKIPTYFISCFIANQRELFNCLTPN